MNALIEAAGSMEKLGIVGMLALVLIGLTYAVRLLYKDRKSCESSRLGDAEERAEIRETLGEVKGRLSTMEQFHYEHLIGMKNKDNK
jgi:hypothetical protein